ncbi:Siderophore iron transporter-like protein [Emericellopsis cladophorae]|uniref:Siderophore iron transporter-like protein n=1 Tax=Emericellopsis cladophorae TaxID=2686198 RepID=A0A9P9Y588_9HYPO|nr:Siderophore iron transporter-like protein [Emericellopsis cladophorae]KAI6783661.1 Siderophore iron transporter-like protein [Emericellopsis cladophorae]
MSTILEPNEALAHTEARRERSSSNSNIGTDKKEATYTDTGAEAARRDPADDTDHEAIDKEAQAGVQNIEATTTVWSKKALIFAYVWIWVIYFVNTMQQGATGALTPYVTSAFQEHSLTPTVSIMSNIIGGVSKLVIAKILDVVGRPTGYLVTLLLMTVGLIMMAACNSVEMYAAAQVFYWVGYNGISFTLSVFIADTSHLKNRGLMLAYVASPYIITTWLSGPISEAFLDGPGFRWGFGVFSILTPVFTLPLWGLFVYYARVAKSRGLIKERESGRTRPQSVLHYLREFDVVGLVLIIAGLGLFLLSFNIQPRQSAGWEAPIVLVFLLVGLLLLVAFGVWEKFFAPVKFMPFELLTDRTVAGACLMAATLFVSFYIWNSYFYSFLQAVNGLTVTEASYVAQIYSIGSCFWSFAVGYAIRRTGRFKWVALYFGVPITILGAGLMIQFRQPHVNIGYIVMCQIFIAFGGGAVVITQQIAVMAVTAHQHVAVVLAVESMFTSIGGAIGQTVSSAIWQHVFPRALGRRLPDDTKDQAMAIYGSLEVQLDYPLDSPTRIAIQDSYGEAVRYMLIAATSVLVLAIAGVAMWRDVNVKDKKQVKGLVV